MCVTEVETPVRCLTDYDTKVCGVTECPMDCGLVRHEGDCVFCHCADSPLAELGKGVGAGRPALPDGAQPAAMHRAPIQ